jgi:hypothetical protein
VVIARIEIQLCALNRVCELPRVAVGQGMGGAVTIELAWAERAGRLPWSPREADVATDEMLVASSTRFEGALGAA